MTVQFLAAWNGYEQFQVATLTTSEEARLVAVGVCRAYTAGQDGRSLVPVVQDPISGSQFAGQSLLSGYWKTGRVAVIGTSISETQPYTIATSATAVGDGTWDIVFGGNPRGIAGEGEDVQITQGPAGVNTRFAVINSIAGNVVNVTPDTTRSIPLTGVAPLIYRRFDRAFGGYVPLAQELSACAFDVTVDAAIGGADTAQLLSIFDRDVGSRAAEFDAVVAELGGMNGVYARGNSFDVEQALSQAYIDKVAALCKPFLIVGILPRGSATGSYSGAKADLAARINAWAEGYARSKGGAFLNGSRISLGPRSYLDTASATADPRITECTTDGVHPNSGGGIVLGAGVAHWADSIFAPADPLVTSIRDAAVGLLNTNPFLSGTGGAKTGGMGATVTGNVADGCDVVVSAGGADCTVTCSVLDRTEALHGDAVGKAQRMVITTGATASTIVEFRFAGNLAASVVNGDNLFASAATAVSNGGSPGVGDPVALASTALTILAQTATTGNKFINSTGAATAACNQVAHRARKRTPVSKIRAPMAIHGAPSNVRAAVSIYLRANANVCIDIGRVALFKS